MSLEDFTPVPIPPERRVTAWVPDGPFGDEGTLYLICGHVVPGSIGERSAPCLKCSLYPPVDPRSEPNEFDRVVERMRGRTG